MPATERRRHIRLAIVTIAALAVLGASRGPIPVERTAASQVAGDPAESWWISLSTWLRAVERHTPAQRDTDLVAIAAFSWNDLEGVLADYLALFKLVSRAYEHTSRSDQQTTFAFRSYVFTVGEAERLLFFTERNRSPDRVLKRAALLHTEISLLVDNQSRDPSATMDTGVVVVRDGQRNRFRLLRAAPGVRACVARSRVAGPCGRFDGAPVVPEQLQRFWLANGGWVTLTGTSSGHGRDLPGGRADPAGQRMPARGVCLCQDPEQYRDTPKLPRGMLVGVGSSGRELRRAGLSSFRQALEADETLTQARVRLARAIGLEGDHAEAARELHRGAVETDDTTLPSVLRVAVPRQRRTGGAAAASTQPVTPIARPLRSTREPNRPGSP